MKNSGTILVAFIVAVAASYLTLLITSEPVNKSAQTGSARFEAADPVMARINKSGTINCGYVSYNPASYKDQETGEMTGYAVDLVEEAAHRMELEVDWAYESNWPLLSTDLKAGKFDMACVAYWLNPWAARKMLGTIPALYQPVFLITKADDTRFDDGLAGLNDPDIKVAVLDGDVPMTLLNQYFPEATQNALPQMSDFALVFQEVASGRADATLAAIADMHEFDENNPGVLKAVTAHPVKVFPSVFLMSPRASQLQFVMNTALWDMHIDGTTARILNKYARTPHDFYIPEHGYHTFLKTGEKASNNGSDDADSNGN